MSYTSHSCRLTIKLFFIKEMSPLSNSQRNALYHELSQIDQMKLKENATEAIFKAETTTAQAREISYYIQKSYPELYENGYVIIMF